MARSSYFACMDCKVQVWLGSTAFNSGDTVNYFSAFLPEKRNWQDLELNRVIWKMLADHAGHELRVLIEWTPEFDVFMDDEEVVRIGGDEPEHDISFEEYLKDWEG